MQHRSDISTNVGIDSRIKSILLNLVLFVGLILFLHLVSIDLTISQQFEVSYALLIILIILEKIKYVQKTPVRICFLLISSFISLRYWYWRTFDTLIYTGFFDFIAMMLLYLDELYSMSIYFLGMFVNIWPFFRKPVPLPSDPESLPTVDIFIPTYNEPEDIVRVTVTACTQIDYPEKKMRIYILDDGATIAKRNNPKTSNMAWERYHSFKKMAEELGVNYLAREKNDHAKAGNINSALKYSSGELILILDCDHIPSRDILKNTVGCFLKDDKLFLVQTPHYFINPDPIEKNLDTFFNAPSENQMFYMAIQHGLDFWNSSFFCGSAAILRRKYLEEVGGISGNTITEDAETSLLLQAKGYNSAYIGIPMIYGLSPETFDDFILQRSRWAQGMVQIFILKNPLLTKGLKIYQRICYINSTIFWFFSLSRVIFFITPIFYLVFGLKIYNASALQVWAYAIPHLFCSLIVSNLLYGKVRWPFFSELYETVQSIFLFPAIISTINNPKAPKFKVTPKGVPLKSDFLSPLAGPFYIVFFIILASFLAVPTRWFFYPLQRDAIIVCASWNLFNLFLILACLGIVWERQQVRHFHRLWVRKKATIFLPRLNLRFKGEINDLSLTGIGINLSFNPSLNALKEEEKIVIEAEDNGENYKFPAKLIKIMKKEDFTKCGCKFSLEETPFSSVVKFVYGDSEKAYKFLKMKSKSISFWQALVYLVNKGIKGSIKNFRGLIYLVYATVSKFLKKYFYLPLLNIFQIMYKKIVTIIGG